MGSLLSEHTEELAEILGEKLGLFHRGKMATPGHGGPAHNVEPPLGKFPGRHGDFFGKERYCYGPFDPVGG